MLVLESHAEGAQVRIEARGNFSLSANGLVILLLTLGGVTLGLAGLLALQGYWPILVVAVIQLILVAWLLIRVWKNTWVLEQICIDAEHVSVMHQRYRRKSHHRLDTAWATIRIERPQLPWYSPKLILRSKNQELELGAFLTDSEKLSLAKHLANIFSEHSAWGRS